MPVSVAHYLLHPVDSKDGDYYSYYYYHLSWYQFSVGMGSAPYTGTSSDGLIDREVYM
jgi:hypothetical protein